MKQFNYETRDGDDNRIRYPDDTFDLNTGELVDDGSLLWTGATRIGDVVVGVYSGTLPLADYIPPQRYETSLSGYRLIKMLGVTSYGLISAGANAGDPVAVYFIELAKQMGVENRPILTTHPDYILSIGSFLASAYIDQAKHDEMLLGAPL